MSGYAASARLRGGSTRFMPIAGAGARDASMVGSAKPAAWFEVDDRDRIDRVGRPFGERLAARWDDLRETWSQTTFFLFSPESWR